MDIEKTNKLWEAFPHLYQGKDMGIRASLIPFGFECGDGWFDLLWDLSKKLTELIEALPESEREHIYASQVKEKYGELCFYMTTATNEMWDLIEEAEKKSTTICDICGMPGKLREYSGWYSTKCETCADRVLGFTPQNGLGFLDVMGLTNPSEQDTHEEQEK